MELKELKAVFVKGVRSPKDYPTEEYPEVAFIGRSNVGKSSLLNSIVLNRKVAFISAEPGKTQEINFFLISDKWMFADLPGFGYAKAPKTLRDDWVKLNYNYLLNRENIALICVLIDSRHDPQPIDLELIEKLEHGGRRYVIVLTKCDKIPKKDVIERKAQIDELVSQCSFCVEVLPYSSKEIMGRSEILAIIKRETKNFVKQRDEEALSTAN